MYPAWKATIRIIAPDANMMNLLRWAVNNGRAQDRQPDSDLRDSPDLEEKAGQFGRLVSHHQACNILPEVLNVLSERARRIIHDPVDISETLTGHETENQNPQYPPTQ